MGKNIRRKYFVSIHTDVNTTGVADGDGLIFDSSAGRFNVGALPSTGFSIAMAAFYNKEKKWHKTLEDIQVTMLVLRL